MTPVVVQQIPYSIVLPPPLAVTLRALSRQTPYTRTPKAVACDFILVEGGWLLKPRVTKRQRRD